MAIPIVGILFIMVMFIAICGKSSWIEFKNIARPIVFIIILALIISMSLLIVSKFSIEILVFLLRVITSITIFAIIVRLVGWRNILLGFRSIELPPELIWMTHYTIRFILLFINEVLRLLIARKARM